MTHRAAQASADIAMAIIGIAVLSSVAAVVTLIAVLIYVAVIL